MGFAHTVSMQVKLMLAAVLHVGVNFDLRGGLSPIEAEGCMMW